nr:MAG TPA: hypothetical protein [Caudoviricetes sp.]
MLYYHTKSCLSIPFFIFFLTLLGFYDTLQSQEGGVTL